jgi:hypothetical protein
VADAPVPPPPPVAIRITRPYATEDEYLEKELETLTRAGITLLGAQSRPQGVVLRFELVLTSGHVLMRGEGRVLGFKANAFAGIGGLTLRFTRLDTRSKSLIDKAVALREMRRPSSRPPDPLEAYMPRPVVAEPAAPGPAAHAPAVDTPPPIPPFPLASQPVLPGPQFSTSTTLPYPFSPSMAPDPSAPASARGVVVPPPASAPRLTAEAASSDRDSLLERLRARAKALDPSDVQKILSSRRG